MKQRGLTIVEIIIILVVIGILATIGGLAWHTAQNNAIDSKVKSDFTLLADAIEQYYQENGQYPFPMQSTCEGHAANWAISNWRFCKNGEIASLLVPKYLKEIPRNKAGGHYHYHVDKIPARYGLKLDFSNSKCIAGKDIHPSWRFDGYTEDCPI